MIIKENKEINQQKLNCYRKEIDKIDENIIKLLEERIEIVKNVGKLKKSNNENFFIKSAREADMIRNLINKTNNLLFKNLIYDIWRKIISTANLLEQEIKILICSKSNVNFIIENHYNNIVHTANTDDVDFSIFELKKNKINILFFELKPKYANIKDVWWIKIAREKDINLFIKLPFLVINNLEENLNKINPSHKSKKNRILFGFAIKPHEKSNMDDVIIYIETKKDIRIKKNEIISKFIDKKNISYFLIRIDDLEKFKNQNNNINYKILGYCPKEIVI